MKTKLILNFIILFLLIILAGIFVPSVYLLFWIVIPLFCLGLYNLTQTKHTILRNYPVVGPIRYMLEAIRPEIQQYFIETDCGGRPVSRLHRIMVYSRAKLELTTLPFGTQHEVRKVGYEWLDHSIAPTDINDFNPRVIIGGKDCTQKYSASIFNISAMSFGAISKNAVLALNQGAKLGGFYHNTGEGGLSDYHLEYAGDIVWQLGTAYFGARDEKGNFCAEKFAKTANLPNIKMIELKLSQGAKPGFGGMLPKEKISKEIAKFRQIPENQDFHSPSGHSAFNSPKELMLFIAKLRKLSGGKPVGIKLCVGNIKDLFSLVKAMLDTNILPDFITVDGGEGGTGAAPMEFANHVGAPINEGLNLVNNVLIGANLRNKITIIASGKIISSYQLAAKIALGADVINSARGMMLALGCINALRCNTNSCPTGITTQNPRLVAGLDVKDKSLRVKNYHSQMIKHLNYLASAAGLKSVHDFNKSFFNRRISATECIKYSEIYSEFVAGSLLSGNITEKFKNIWNESEVNHW